MLNPVIRNVFLPASLLLVAAHAQTGPETVVVRTLLPAGEQGMLLLSQTRTAEYRVPGTTLDLGLDPSAWMLVPIDRPTEQGAREVVMVLPPGVDLARMPWFGQVVVVSARGLRAMPLFRLTSGDGPVVPASASAKPVPEVLIDTHTGAASRADARSIMVSRNVGERITRFTLNGRPLTPRVSSEIEGFAPRDVGPVELLQPAMSAPSLVASPSAYPSCVHGRILITWPNGAQGQGTGTLIDSKHVITAGHVVYQAAKGGWATSLTFDAGYDNGAIPFGSAVSPSGNAWRHSWTNWTVDGDNTHDIGWFQVDRPVGALTGWHGYGYTTDCNFYLTTYHYTRSYPGETPYTGLLMYQRSGTFDSCPTERETSFNLYSYGGESGAGYYYLNSNGSRYVRAIGSHRDSPTRADRVRLTETKFNDIIAGIAAARASAVDFTPVGVVIDATTTVHVARGSALPNLDFTAHNYSTASFNGTLTWTVRLSTNTTITTADTLLKTTSSTFSVGATGSMTINHTNPPVIPTTVSPGTYYVGIILTLADANGSNQATLPADVAKVIVD
jgi:V8-like Glu-specific endopeptidase